MLKRGSTTPEVRALHNGTLVIHVKAAHNLMAKDRNGLSDPYVVINVHGKRRFRTAIKYATLDPVWDQFGEYSGQLGVFVKSPLVLKLYDYDRLNFNDPLGDCTIDLTPLIHKNKIVAEGVPLKNAKHGSIDVCIHFEQTAVNFAFPSPVAASALAAINEAVMDIPSDAHWLERRRDATLAFLATHKLFVYLTGLWIVAVVVWVILLVLIFPLHLGWVPWEVYGMKEADAKQAWVVCNTVLCSLFTWQNGLSFPWRVACLIHLFPCFPRCADPGLDFYGRETESMFFHIPTRHRAGIVAFLIGAVVLQFLQQVFRGMYTTYETSERQQPGQVLIITSFAGSIVCAIVGGIYQFVQLYRLHGEYPERFPPSAAVTSIAHFSHVWKHGGGKGCCQVMRGAIVEFKEQTEKFQERRRQSMAVGALPAFDRGKYGEGGGPGGGGTGGGSSSSSSSSNKEEEEEAEEETVRAEGENEAIAPPLARKPSLISQRSVEMRRKLSRQQSAKAAPATAAPATAAPVTAAPATAALATAAPATAAPVGAPPPTSPKKGESYTCARQDSISMSDRL